MFGDLSVECCLWPAPYSPHAASRTSTVFVTLHWACRAKDCTELYPNVGILGLGCWRKSDRMTEPGVELFLAFDRLLQEPRRRGAVAGEDDGPRRSGYALNCPPGRRVCLLGKAMSLRG